MGRSAQKYSTNVWINCIFVNDETNSFYKMLTGGSPDLSFARCTATGVCYVLMNSSAESLCALVFWELRSVEGGRGCLSGKCPQSHWWKEKVKPCRGILSRGQLFVLDRDKHACWFCRLWPTPEEREALHPRSEWTGFSGTFWTFQSCARTFWELFVCKQVRYL